MKDEYLELEDIIEDMELKQPEPDPEQNEWLKDMCNLEVPEHYLIDNKELERLEIEKAIHEAQEEPDPYLDGVIIIF